jgi:hypothetical protein
MTRRLLLGSAALLFVAAVVCAGVVGVGIGRLLLGMSEVGEGVSQVIRLRPWGYAFWGCALSGFVLLWFVRDKGGNTSAEPTASNRGRLTSRLNPRIITPAGTTSR